MERWPQVSAALASQSGGGGLSALATPLLVPIAIVAAIILGRERLAWWAVPVFWPYTQWYYASMVLPVATPLAAVALATPIPGATTVAIVLAAIEAVRRRRSIPPGDWIPRSHEPRTAVTRSALRCVRNRFGGPGAILRP